MRVIFTEIANETYDGILEFLSQTWTEKEIKAFENDVESVVFNLESGNSKQYQISKFGTRSALIGKKHVRMFFEQVSSNLILVLLFFETREDPGKIRILLQK